MKSISKYILPVFCISLLLGSCADDELIRAPDVNDPSIIGAVTLVSPNPNLNFFNFLSSDFGSEAIEFDLDVDGFGVTEVNSVDVMMTFTEKDAVFNPFKNEFEDLVYDPVSVANITSFPSTVSFSAGDAAAALGFDSVDSLEVGDSFLFTFPINTADGRTLTTALNSDLCNEPAQPSFGGCSYSWAVVCPSDLAGTFDYVATNIEADNTDASGCIEPVTGSGTLTDKGSGVYALSDATFGQYDCAWGDTPAIGVTLVESCGQISFGGSDQYGLIYGFTLIDNDGASITIDWFNDYGDRGRAKLTRTDGRTWPDNLTD